MFCYEKGSSAPNALAQWMKKTARLTIHKINIEKSSEKFACKCVWKSNFNEPLRASSIESHLNLKQIIKPNSNIYVAEREA